MAPQVALCVSWTERPRSLRLGFGVLVFERPLVSLRDRMDAALFVEDARAIGAAAYKEAMIALSPPVGGPFYITGFTGQQKRDRLAAELVERYGAVALPSRTQTERQAVEHVWQASTLELLGACGVAIAATGPPD